MDGQYTICALKPSWSELRSNRAEIITKAHPFSKDKNISLHIYVCICLAYIQQISKKVHFYVCIFQKLHFKNSLVDWQFRNISCCGKRVKALCSYTLYTHTYIRLSTTNWCNNRLWPTNLFKPRFGPSATIFPFAFQCTYVHIYSHKYIHRKTRQ